ncbi:MAG: DUF2059 domain-containing protein [Bacteroidaceae bacterium]
MKQILVAMCLLFLCTVGVKAQDETYKKAFKEMLEVSGSNATFDQMPQIMEAMKTRMTSSPEGKKAMEGFDFSIHKEDMDFLMDLLMPVYYKYYTLKDIKKIIAFYKTPVGKKLKSSAPQIAVESAAAMQPFAERISKRFMDQMQKTKEVQQKE